MKPTITAKAVGKMPATTNNVNEADKVEEPVIAPEAGAADTSESAP